MRRLVLWFPLILPAYVLRFSIGPLPTTVLEIAFVALAAGLTWQEGWSIWREGLRRSKPWHLAMLAWFFATLIAVAIAPDRIGALGLWRAYVLEPMLFGVLAWSVIKTEADRRTVLHALITIVTLIAVWCVFQFVTNSHIPTPWNTADLASRRATGPFPFPNAVALFVVPLTALFLGLLISKERPPTKQLWLIIGSLSGIIATLLAKSDGGLIALLACVGLALLWNPKTRWKAVALGAIGAITILAVPALRTRALDVLLFREWSGKVRLIIWNESWTMLKDRPLTGAGLGAYPDVILPYHKATFIEVFQYPHTILLNFWSETGPLGVLAFSWICLTWFRSRKQGSSIYLLPLVAILVHGLVDVPYFKNDLAMQFWLLTVLAGASATFPSSKTLA
jgi:O-antigen ligase